MFENIQVKDWMSGQVEIVSPAITISEAHQIMKDKNIRRLPVIEDDRLVGIVTIGDIREASPSDATSLSIWELTYLWAQLTVEKIMTHTVLTINPNEPIIMAAQIMLEHKVSGLPVIDDDGKLVGIITESDIFRMLIRNQNAVPSH